MEKKTNKKLFMVLLLLVCVCVLLIILFFLTPIMTEVVTLAREYQVKPDTWTYYAILGCCVVAFAGSLFLIFHHYLLRDRNNDSLEA